MEVIIFSLLLENDFFLELAADELLAGPLIYAVGLFRHLQLGKLQVLVIFVFSSGRRG